MSKSINLGLVDIENFNQTQRLFAEWCYEDDAIEDFVDDMIECIPNEIILEPNTEYKLTIDYPLTTKYVEKIKTLDVAMNRLDFVTLVCNRYKQIYDIEKTTSKTKEGCIPGMYNRMKTNGMYGIWGHMLGDLTLHTLDIDDHNNLELGVDS
jgi:hypothetical protein